MTWALLSLPLIDVLLSLLPGLWPGVLKVSAYLYLVRRVQDLYCFTAATLFWAGLFRFLSSSEDTQWSLLVGGGVRAADSA
jgi:hypothetical protein